MILSSKAKLQSKCKYIHSNEVSSQDYMSLVVGENRSSGFPTRSDTNQDVPSLKKARGK